jgi:hypothetical protein
LGLAGLIDKARAHRAGHEEPVLLVLSSNTRVNRRAKPSERFNGPGVPVGLYPHKGMGPVENHNLIRLPPVISPIHSISITNEFCRPHGGGRWCTSQASMVEVAAHLRTSSRELG